MELLKELGQTSGLTLYYPRPFCVCSGNEGSDETVHMHRLI